jgi:G:T-mismatch repair DNA endonuclease (very short patch repair protein)
LRDAAKVAALEAAGFRVAIVWECETANLPRLRRRLQRWPKRLS